MLISVLTPVRNGARFVEGAIASVKAQGLASEHIIVDGASTDGTPAMISQFSHEGMTWLSEPDLGQSDALNKALAQASGDIISWLNIDERYLPGTFEKILEVFHENPDVDVVYGDFVQIRSDGTARRLVSSHRFSKFVLRYYGVYIPSCSTFIRRTSLSNFSWDISLRMIMDWDLWLDLDSKGKKFHHVSSPLGLFLMHPLQVTAADPSKFEHEFEKVRARYAISHDARVLNAVAGLRHRFMKLLEGSYLRELNFLRSEIAKRDFRDDFGI
jgi:glycosyltransferase involved in cell wall biosynthesis